MRRIAGIVMGLALGAAALAGCFPDPEPYAGPEGAPHVAVVGDSLLSSAETEIDAVFSDVEVSTSDAPGQTVAQVQDTIEDYVQGNPDVQVLIIGTNDWFQPIETWTAALKKALDTMAPVPVVLWVNHSEDVGLIDIWGDGKYEHHLRYNLALFRHERSGNYPNLHILDWASAVVPGDAAADGIHLTQQGQDHLAAFVREGYDQWFTPTEPPTTEPPTTEPPTTEPPTTEPPTTEPPT